MSNISVVINTLNEEKNLPRVLSSIKGFADEIVVVDMKSDDNTQAIAKSAGAEVYLHEPTGYVEPARNFAIAKAKSEWVLILDADEEIGPELKSALKKIVGNPLGDYYALPRKNIIFNKWMKHSRWWPDYNIRFFKKGSVSWSEVIHSVPMTVGTGMDLEALEENAIVHYHYSSLEQYITRLNRYTTQHSKVLSNDGYNFKWQHLIQKPVSEFLSRYFQGEGYKDGVHGLALSSLQAFSELVLYLKLWEIDKFKPSEVGLKNVLNEIKESEKSLNYWQADTLIKNGGGVGQRIKRKFKLP